MNSSKIILCSIFLLIISNYSLSQNTWQQTAGPTGGSLSAMSIDSSGNFYAGRSVKFISNIGRTFLS